MRYLLLTLMLLLFSSPKAQTLQPYINVIGTAEITIPADQIEFQIAIKSIQKSVKEAKINTDKQTRNLVEILKEIGVKSSDIEIAPISLGKNIEYQNRKREQNGFYVTTNLSFTLSDISKYSEFANKLAESNYYEVLYSSYKISDFVKQKQKAYEKALLAAKAKAEYMAKALNTTVGTVLEIDETGSTVRPYKYAMNDRAQQGFGNQQITGKVSITESIRVKFELN